MEPQKPTMAQSDPHVYTVQHLARSDIKLQLPQAWLDIVTSCVKSEAAMNRLSWRCRRISDWQKARLEPKRVAPCPNSPCPQAAVTRWPGSSPCLWADLLDHGAPASLQPTEPHFSREHLIWPRGPHRGRVTLAARCLVLLHAPKRYLEPIRRAIPDSGRCVKAPLSQRWSRAVEPPTFSSPQRARVKNHCRKGLWTSGPGSTGRIGSPQCTFMAEHRPPEFESRSEGAEGICTG